MLREQKHQLADLPGELSDLDLTPSGNWIGVTNLDDSQWMLFNGTSTPLSEEFRFPKIRAIDDRTAVLVNSRAWNEDNGWILDSSGKPKARFYAGDAIQDVLASPEFIVITYFDESALTSPGIEGNGVAVFDVAGNFLFGYRDLFGDEAVAIADCYAACWAGDNSILFFPYTDFPLVSFENKTKRKSCGTRPTPWLAAALSPVPMALSFFIDRIATRALSSNGSSAANRLKTSGPSRDRCVAWTMVNSCRLNPRAS
jgi:hypothetical protein